MNLINSYLFWWLIIGFCCLLLERIRPWRQQKLLRPEILQDLAFFLCNGQLFPFLIALFLSGPIEAFLLDSAIVQQLAALQFVLTTYPLWVQIIIILLVKDFFEYWTHYSLHRFPLLWRYHKLHHSIRELDWIGNYRFHYAEIILYKIATWLPLYILIPTPQVFLPIMVISTFIGNLNHSNVAINLGPFRKIVNSAPLHVWHHDLELHQRYGQNFGVLFSIWDVLFGTYYFPTPMTNPKQLGYQNQQLDTSAFLTRLSPWPKSKGIIK